MIIFHDDSGKFVGGWVGDGLDAISKSLTDGIVNGFLQIIDYIILFIYWGCKIGIIVCMLTYFCSQDKKAVSTGIKLGFLFLIISIIGGSI
jgi:hypothetical protein